MTIAQVGQHRSNVHRCQENLQKIEGCQGTTNESVNHIDCTLATSLQLEIQYSQ